MKRLSWLLVAVLIFCTSACSLRKHTPSVVPGWRRAGLIGTSSRAKPVSLAVGANDSKVILGWIARTESDQDYIHLYVLDRNGSILFNENLQPTLFGLDQVKLSGDKSGSLHLNWTSGSQNARVLWTATLPSIPQEDGLISLRPVQMTQPDSSVVWFESYALKSDGRVLLWRDDEDNVYVRLDSTGTQYKILENAQAFDAALNAEGTLELTWASITDENRVHINVSTLDVVDMHVSTPQTLTRIRLTQENNATFVSDLLITRQENHRRISWTQPFDYGGRSGRQLVTAAIVDDKGNTTQSPAVITTPLTRSFPPELALDSTTQMQVVQPLNGSINETNVRSANSSTVMPNQGVVLSTSVQYATRTREVYQPTLVYFNDEGIVGYQPLTWTDFPSLYPVVASDRSGNLYTAWIDNIGIGFNYPVYLASTNPAIQEKFRYLSLDDYAVIGWDWLNRAVLGIVLIPFIIQWFILPVCYLVVVLIRGHEYGKKGTYAFLGGVFLYWASKYLMTSQVLTLLPDLRTASQLIAPQLIMPFLVPVLVLNVCVIGDAVHRRYTHRSEDRLFIRFLRIALPDAALSMIIYSIGSFG